MKKAILAFATSLALATGVAHAADNDDHGAFGRLDHVFLIIMENQTNTDILGNPNLPFINSYVNIANHATNYFAVGHPSAPNYLEIIGGSNFGLKNDFWPNWLNTGCTDNAPGSTGCVNALTPIAAPGVDNAVVATATTPTQCNGQITLSGAPVPNNCALYDYPAKAFTPRSIADQLTDRGMSWKTYQESLPIVTPGVFGVNYSDGAFSNLSPPSVFVPGPIQKLYAVKHNPFAYFRNVEESGLAKIVDFDGKDGLWADLQSKGDELPNLMVIVPNQCHDMHGFVSDGTPICSTNTSAESAFLLSVGDAEVEKLVTGIKASPAWQHGRNVTVLVWDENDFSNAPNHVVMAVETNYSRNGRVSDNPYDHFSLLKTLEAGFGLPCLNHACDPTSQVMNDVFGGDRRQFSNR
jgi:phosphatidylinositol-3-phosphatase